MSITVDIFNEFDMNNVVVAMMQYVLITSHRLLKRIIRRVILNMIADKATKAHHPNLVIQNQTYLDQPNVPPTLSKHKPKKWQLHDTSTT